MLYCPTYESYNCPNRVNHVSAFPANNRIVCPYCGKKYIRRPRPDERDQNTNQ
jgi:DNA-directed RNA polymerase subunit RPC12/RpoP